MPALKRILSRFKNLFFNRTNPTYPIRPSGSEATFRIAGVLGQRDSKLHRAQFSQLLVVLPLHERLVLEPTTSLPFAIYGLNPIKVRNYQ
jgi:hypothetical protein